MGTVVRSFGWAFWHVWWVFMAALVGLGLATLGIGVVLSITCLTIYTFTYFVSTISWHSFLKEVFDAQQADT